VRQPAYPGYLADPFALRILPGYACYGTGPSSGDRVFEVLESSDMQDWTSRGHALRRPSEALGDEYWAPEVAFADGQYWMYYSVGHGIAGHHLRVARSDSPFGPFDDLGIDLTPDERFAIDPHPFRDDDGTWSLFFARDVLDDPRPGTHLAAVRLESMTATAGDVQEVLSPSADWQIYERDRRMYDAIYDWHTLEGPSVVKRGGRYWLTYSGGAWTGAGYGVSWAVADTLDGPWQPAPPDAPLLLQTAPDDLLGPGHNSLTTAPDGSDVIVFHAWNADGTARQMHVEPIEFTPDGPRLGSASGRP
jgi:beta-xylosidase